MKNVQFWYDQTPEEATALSGLKGSFLVPAPDAGRPGNAFFTPGNVNQKIVESLPGWFYLLDRELRLVLWNENFRRATGSSNEALQGMSVLKFHEASHQADTAAALVRIFRLGEYVV